MGDDIVHAGDVLAGRYRVERVLGRGGVAIVLSVTDIVAGERRALKLLAPEARALPSTVERSFREARAMARLTSKHAVRILDVGTFDDGAPYLVMEHLEGTDLGALLKRRGALPAHEAVLYVLQACEAIGEAHESGIVHRDLKPRNLFLTRGPGGEACVKVLDFGFSKQRAASERDRDVTLSNAVLGSPAYMSPDQILSPRSVDARTDVWSLGVVLYQLVTGQLPFKHEDAARTIAQVMGDTPAPPSSIREGLPLALDAVVMRCLEKDPARRFADAGQLAAALAPFVPWNRRAGAPVEAPAMARRGQLLLTIVLVVVAGTLAIVAVAMRG
jgi:serine/threonine-protein kinase